MSYTELRPVPPELTMQSTSGDEDLHAPHAGQSEASLKQNLLEDPHDPKKSKTLLQSSGRPIFRLWQFVALLVIPIALMILGAFICVIRGRPEYSLGRAVTQATKVASTLWPIAFAAVVGPMLASIALYRAERGTTVAMIEMLMGSQTLGNTVKSSFSLRILSLSTFLLLLLWSLSPLGGQAVLRSITLQQYPQTATYPLLYHPISNVSMITHSPWTSGAFAGQSLSRVQALFGAALTSLNALPILCNGTSPSFNDAIARLGGTTQAVRSSQRDVWGNPRIPLLQMLPGYDQDHLSDWVDVPTDEIPPYESLIGIPVRGIPVDRAGNMSFIAPTFYSTLECSPWENLTTWLPNHSSDLVSNEMVNSTRYLLEPKENMGQTGMAKIWMDMLKSTGKVTYAGVPPDYFPLYNRFVFGTAWNITACNLSTSFVEVDIFCSRTTTKSETMCKSTRARHDPRSPFTTNDTVLSRAGMTTPMWMPKVIPFLLPSMGSSVFTPLELYLRDPAAGDGRATSFTRLSYEDIPMRVFQARLALIFNTVIRLSFNTTVTLGTDGLGIDLTNRRDCRLNCEEIFANTTGTWTEWQEPVYAISKLWLTIYVFATMVVAACACATVVLRVRTKAPDFLGSVAALTRDTPFVSNMDACGSGMGGAEMARLQKDKWVRIQDVQPQCEVGRIAFSDDKELALEYLSWGRYYN